MVATMACGRWSLKVRRFESERLRMELVKILGAWARKLVTIARGFRTLNAKTPEPYLVAKCGLLVRSETSQSLKLLSCSQLFQETKSPRRRSCEGFCGRDFGSGHSLSGLDNMLSCACQGSIMPSLKHESLPHWPYSGKTFCSWQSRGLCLFREVP